MINCAISHISSVKIHSNSPNKFKNFLSQPRNQSQNTPNPPYHSAATETLILAARSAGTTTTHTHTQLQRRAFVRGRAKLKVNGGRGARRRLRRLLQWGPPPPVHPLVFLSYLCARVREAEVREREGHYIPPKPAASKAVARDCDGVGVRVCIYVKQCVRAAVRGFGQFQRLKDRGCVRGM